MLSVTEDTQQCHIQGCKYNLKGRCGLNLKSEEAIREPCAPTDNWYIVGSFVLDRIFEKTTANDIDLIAPRGEMPAELPDGVLNAPLRIEMLWKDPKPDHRFECYNTSLPRIGSEGFLNWEVADSLRRNRTISVLPYVRKVSIPSLYIAIKAMVKYDMQPDDKTFSIWVRSTQDPLRWKQLYKLMVDQVGRIESVNWDYLRAEHLIDWLDRAYSESTDTQKKQYLHCLRGVLAKMPLNTDIAYRFLMEWIEASMQSNDQKKRQIWQAITSQRFKFKPFSAGKPLYGGEG